jgi:glycosyltransferase involved in cell wall biosynthesis
MKVLLILEATLGGTGRHILDLAGGLMDRGLEVHFVYSVLRADQQFHAGLASLRAGYPGFRCHSISLTREVTFSDLPSYIELSRYVRKHGPFDVIHAHSTKAGFLARLLLNRGRAGMVYTPHGLMTLNPELTGARRQAVCALESMLARRSDVVVAVSGAERRCAKQTGIDVSKLLVIPNGIRQIPPENQWRARASIRDSLSLTPSSVCIGFVGRFIVYKKPERVIEAFASLKRRTAIDVQLVMIGGGPLEMELRNAASRLGIADRVHFLGEVDGALHMSAFDILAHASSFEAFGYVFVEALSSGVPIVTTAVGGTDELISHGVTGYVCDPWDPNTFADYLQILAEDPQLRAKMSVAARERAAAYSATKMVDSVAELYRRLCARPDPAASVTANYETLPGNSK